MIVSRLSPQHNGISTTSLLLILFSLFLWMQVATCDETASAGDCRATISLNSTYPTHAFYIYHYVMVQNIGGCDITKVYVNITLPPGETRYAYNNISNSTGELLGLSAPFHSLSIQKGGSIVLPSARVPIVILKKVECGLCTIPRDDDSSSSPSPSSPPTSPPSLPTTLPSLPPSTSPSTIKIEVVRGSNEWWMGVRVIESVGESGESRGESGEKTAKVHLREPQSNAWKRMKPEAWEENVITYTFSTSSPTGLSLPLSLKLTSAQGDIIFLDDIISSISYNVVDSQVTYEDSTVSKRSLYISPSINNNNNINNNNEDNNNINNNNN